MQASDIQRLQWAGPNAGAMLYDADAFDAPTPTLLEASGFATVSTVGEGGRQAAWFVADTFGEGVLRHYRRGGLIARLSRDRYLWAGESRTRSFAEFGLLVAMRTLGLPVPQPLAAGYWRHGVTYAGALLTRRIPEVQALASCLDHAPLEDVARAIVAMHRAGVWHADLNAFNIMVDRRSKVWLLDFDRSRMGGLNDAAREANVKRLGRSLRKVAGERGDAVFKQIELHYQALWRA